MKGKTKIENRKKILLKKSNCFVKLTKSKQEKKMWQLNQIAKRKKKGKKITENERMKKRTNGQIKESWSCLLYWTFHMIYEGRPAVVCRCD